MVGVCRGSRSFTAQLFRSAHSHVHYCRFDCAWRLCCVFPSLVFLRWVLMGQIIAYKLLRCSQPLRLEKRLRCKMPYLRLVRTFCLQLRVKLRKLPFNRPGRLSLEFRQNCSLSSHRQFKLLSPRNGCQVLLRSPRLYRVPPL